MAKKELPDLHKQAFTLKNRKRLQHDGGRAWVKDSQLHEARKDGNYHLDTTDKNIKPRLTSKNENHNPSF